MLTLKALFASFTGHMHLPSNKSLRSLLVIFAILTIYGVIMVYSSSYIYAKETFGSSTYFFKKQFLFILIGLFLIALIQCTNFTKLLRNIQTVHLIAIGLLLCTLLPGIGQSAKGSYRWINLGFIGFQPGELVKYTISFFAISYLDSFNTLDKRARILGLLQLISPLLLFLFQPDFGSFIICLTIIGFVLFLSDFPRKYFYAGLGLGLLGIVSLVFMAPYRVQRLMSYLDPWKDPQKSGFQIIQSFLAFANGSLWGKGIGNSDEKLFYLPEAHNDFIFSVIGEELGFFFGVLPIVFLFIAFLFFGFKIALNLNSKTASRVVSVVIFAISLQAFLNMGVVLGLLPTKGLNLPFISYGGSSLMANFMAMGVIISAVKSNTSGYQDSTSMKIPKPSVHDTYRFDYRSRVKR